MPNRRVVVPPYNGVPRLSHQFPVEDVVVITLVDVLDGVGVVDDIDEVDTVTEVVCVGVFAVLVDVEGVVDEEQDANASEAAIRIVNATQTIPLFIDPPIYKNFG